MTAVLPALPRLHITPSPRHGVTQYAQRLADALTRPNASAVVDRVHVHFTDRLWGTDPAGAASAFERLASRASVTVTLHDLPQPSDGARNLERRSGAYRRVVGAAAGVVCNSRHEATLLRRYTDAAAAVTVIPLPVDSHAGAAASGAAASAAAEPVVGVLGFIYPGKGHARVISAVAAVGSRPRPVVEAFGRASDGHEHDVDVLERKAAARAVAWRVTGYLGDQELLTRSRRAAVPVIAHEHVSASGSLASWLSAGRRPIVLASPYMEEMADLHRGALTLVDPRWLPAAIEHALENPQSTWLGDDVRLGPTTAEVAERYRAFWREVGW